MTSNSPFTQAVRASDFTNSIGVNTHIDFTSTAYGNLQVVENALNYIEVHNVRDSVNNPNDVGPNGWWQQVANATGVTFDAFLPEGSPSSMQASLQYIEQMAPQHILASIEGGNEEDDSYATSNGNSLSYTAQYQQTVSSVGQSLDLPVLNMSFGSGWGTNPTQGDYGQVGNISSYSDYANAHIYYGTGNPPNSTIEMVNSLAQISSDHPVIVTETGWYTTGSTTDPNNVSEEVQAKYMLDALFDAYKDGDVKTYLYELLDQHTGDGNSEDNFGLFTSSGTPKPAATALHNMMTLLADTGSTSTSTSFTPGTLSYSLSGTTSNDNTMLMEKSNGSYWLAIWDETRLSGPTSPTDITVPNQTITLNLGSTASSIQVFDPLTGTTAVETVNNASTAQISVPDHPVLVEIIPSGTSSSGGGTLTSNDLSVAVPATLAATASGTVKMAASISDAWAAQSSGTMAMNITTTGGTVTMTDGNGNPVTGSGTDAIHISGTLAQLNADLATLNFVAPNAAGTDTVSVNVWNQAGVQTTQTTTIDVAAGTSSGGSGGSGSSNDLSVTVPATVSASTNGTVKVAASISDAWAASHGGTMALNITTTGGTVTMTDGSGNPVAGSGTDAIHISGTFAQLNADLATLDFVAPNATGTNTVSVNVWNQAGVQTTQATTVEVTAANGGTLTSHDTSIATPSGISLVENSAVQVTGVNVSDAWAAHNSGALALNVTATTGTVAMTDSNGNAIAGSGTDAIHLSGTLAQINADLASLSYHASASAGAGDISVNVWNQAGVSTTQLIAVNNLLPGNVTNATANAIISGSTGGSLTGSGVNDTFYFTPQNTGTGSTVDHITNFNQAGGDRIDLHGFGLTSANFNSTGTLSGSKSFTFEQLTDSGGHPYTLVTIETNGSHTPQYEIQLDNVHATLHAGDFIFAQETAMYASDSNPLSAALASLKPVFYYLMFFSLVSNVFALAIPLYSLQVLDRVIASGSMDTLFWLTVITLAVMAAVGLIQLARGAVMQRANLWLDRALQDSLVKRTIGMSAAATGGVQPGTQMLRDFQTVKTFLTGSFAMVLLDAPWSALYFLAVMLIHPLIGVIVLAGSALLIALAFLNERAMRAPLMRANTLSVHSMQALDAAARNAEAIDAMGMTEPVAERLRRKSDEATQWQALANQRSAMIQAVSRFARVTLQVMVIGVGAYLAIHQQLTAGAIIACSILANKALAPFENIVAMWRTFGDARIALHRLKAMLDMSPEQPERIVLPEPTGRVDVEGLTYGVVNKILLKDIRFSLQVGESLCVIGPSAAGKSTLIRLLAGVTEPLAGAVRLDGAEMKHWRRDQALDHIGYLPQDVELFEGTVRDNIARMRGDAGDEEIITAARTAQVHDMIMRLPQGYETDIGYRGVNLSQGQRQRIGLARAFFGRPKLVLLDEPNANLDQEGEQALLSALTLARSLGITTVTVTHSMSVLSVADKILLLNQGMATRFGAAKEVLCQLQSPMMKRSA